MSGLLIWLIEPVRGTGLVKREPGHDWLWFARLQPHTQLTHDTTCSTLGWSAYGVVRCRQRAAVIDLTFTQGDACVEIIGINIARAGAGDTQPPSWTCTKLGAMLRVYRCLKRTDAAEISTQGASQKFPYVVAGHARSLLEAHPISLSSTVIRWPALPYSLTLRHTRRRCYSFLTYLSKIFEISRALFLGYRFCPPL